MRDQQKQLRLLRVLHCPTTTGGHPQGLAKAERSWGLDSTSVAFFQNYLKYESDRFLYDKQESKLVQQLKCWNFLVSEARHFDIIHYNAGTGILPWGFAAAWVKRKEPGGTFFRVYCRLCAAVENRLLRTKVIAVTFQGDDARQGDRCLENYELSIAHAAYGTYYTQDQDELNRARVRRFGEVADLIYALNPDLLRVLPPRAKFLPYAHLRPQEWKQIIKAPEAKPVIVHAPSNRTAKGTQEIINAVSKLQAEGVKCELVLVEQTANADAMEIYRRADLIIDQLLAGWYGGFAVEAMALGKPVVCYIRQEDLQFVPIRMAQTLPIINATPDSIYSVLKQWLMVKRNELPERGHLSRDYIEEWHDPEIIARGLASDYQQVFRAKFPEVSNRFYTS